MIYIYTDGGARGNPGPAAIGVYIIDSDGEKITGFGKTIGEATNNAAEYQAVLEALLFLRNNKDHFKLQKVTCSLDSLLVYSQLVGVYKIKHAPLKELWIKIREIEAELGMEITYRHIPREQNTQADFYVNQALDREKLVSYK